MTRVVSLCFAFISSLAVADSASPDRLVSQATNELLTAVTEARGYYETDPTRFFDRVEQIISPLVDFYSFSRGVMGEWGSRSYYQSLQSEEQRIEFDQQVSRFSETFRRALVETYGKGLLAFGGEKIEVKPVPAEDIKSGNVYVIQIIHVEDGPPHIIRYRMKRGRDGSWQIRNVILDEINLGVVYRNQFAASVVKYSGDVNSAIDNWRVEK